MCGILGGNRKEWHYEDALDAIHHRGPDDTRLVKGKAFHMGFVRLAIMDLSDNGMQPMFNKNKSIGITYNGEIYNFDNLKKSLLKKGYRFHSTSDTEIILYAYEEYGVRFVNYIDGIFAIAILDIRKRKLLLFRDRIGVKPLYYYYNGTDFAYCSELKGILTLCHDKNFEVDYTALYDYLTYTYIPDPKTMYQQIYKLPPACMLEFDIESSQIIKKVKYWRLEPNALQGDHESTPEIRQHIKDLISQSVKEQLVADVPVGSFLSGGIDSSIVTYEVNCNDPNIEAFSIGFTDKKFDELSYATLLADTFGITKEHQVVDKIQFKSLYQNLKQWYDEPYADLSAFPTYIVSKLARKKVTVVLTGDGGDEVFGGYSRYQEFLKQGIGNSLSGRRFSRFFEKAFSAMNIEDMQNIERYFFEDIARCCPLYGYLQHKNKIKYAKAWHIDSDYDDYWYFRKYYRKDLPPVTRMQYLDFHTYLPSDILTKVDRASMQVSLEARVPLLSRRIVEYAFSLTETQRLGSKSVLKDALKKAYHNILPNEILYRKKMGFGIPNHYLRNQCSPQEELLHDIWKISV